MIIKKPKNIGFDLDDVLLVFFDNLLTHYNNEFNKNLKLKDITSFELAPIFEMSIPEVRKYVADFFHTDYHNNAAPVKGAFRVVEKLSKENKLFIITAKPDYLIEKTQIWVDVHFPNIFQKIYFANHYHGDENKKRKKSDICMELGIDVFIDDSHENAEDVSSVGIPVLLLDAPWNQFEINSELVTKVSSWSEIEKEIENLI